MSTPAGPDVAASGCPHYRSRCWDPHADLSRRARRRGFGTAGIIPLSSWQRLPRPCAVGVGSWTGMVLTNRRPLGLRRDRGRRHCSRCITRGTSLDLTHGPHSPPACVTAACGPAAERGRNLKGGGGARSPASLLLSSPPPGRGYHDRKISLLARGRGRRGGGRKGSRAVRMIGQCVGSGVHVLCPSAVPTVRWRKAEGALNTLGHARGCQRGREVVDCVHSRAHAGDSFPLPSAPPGVEVGAIPRKGGLPLAQLRDRLYRRSGAR